MDTYHNLRTAFHERLAQNIALSYTRAYVKLQQHHLKTPNSTVALDWHSKKELNGLSRCSFYNWSLLGMSTLVVSIPLYFVARRYRGTPPLQAGNVHRPAAGLLQSTASRTGKVYSLGLCSGLLVYGLTGGRPDDHCYQEFLNPVVCNSNVATTAQAVYKQALQAARGHVSMRSEQQIDSTELESHADVSDSHTSSTVWKSNE